MRFETSHTTPSYLDRRLQLRMLSCVGVISIVMISLSLSRGRPSPETSAARRSAIAAANLTMSAAPVEHRVLKPDEVIILPTRQQPDEHAHQGPRGQWADEAAQEDSSADGALATSRHRADPANGDLFQPRGQERAETSSMFERRHGRSTSRETRAEDHDQQQTHREDVRHEDVHRPSTDSLWEEVTGGSVPTRPPVRARTLDPAPPQDRKSADWQVHTKAPKVPPRTDPLKDVVDQDSFDFDAFGQVADEPKKPVSKRAPDRREPIRNDDGQIVPPRSKPLLVDDEPPRRAPSESNRPAKEDRPLFSDEDLFDLTPPPVAAIPARKREAPRDSVSDAVERGTRAIPVDLRRRDERLLPDDSTGYEGDTGRGELAKVKINRQYLDVVQDNTMGIRLDEAKPYYWLLDHARRVAASKLEDAGLRDVQYINLMTDPDRFRGKPITIEGDLWRLYEFETSRNDYGVERVYEGWVFTGDSANHPYRVVFTSLPKGIEPGENLRKPVRLTGYFFKREGYQSNGGVHFAPTLLARRMTINPMPNGIPLTSGIVPYMIVIIMAVGLALLVTTVGFAIGDERSTRSSRERRGIHPQFSFADLTVPSPISVEESLREFAERERQNAISGAYGPLLSRQAAREHAVHDYSTSRQFALDDQRRQHERQNGVLQDWAARQQAMKDEHQPRHGTRSRAPRAGGSGGNDLDSDKLAQARHLVPKGNPPTRTVLEQAPIMVTSPTQFPPQSPTPAISSSPADPLSSIYAGTRTTELRSSQSDVIQSAVAPAVIPTNISYGASKLSEWEAEVTKLANRSSARTTANPLGVITVSESTTAAQIDHDRLARERVIRERSQRQQDEAEQQRREQFEHHRAEFDHAEQQRLQRERIEHERQLRDRLELERQERLRAEDERLDRERLEFERLDRERVARERTEHERVERERTRSHQEYDRTEPLVDDAFDSSEIADSSDSPTDGNETEPRKRRGGGWGWPRRRQSAEESVEPATDAFDETFESAEPDADRDTSGEPRKRKGGWGWPRRKKEADSTGAGEETASDESASDGNESPQSTSGWGRRRKHRRNWRNDETS